MPLIGTVAEFAIGKSEGETNGEAGSRALASGAGALLGGAAGVFLCGGLTVATGGVGALACGAIAGGLATFGGWAGSEVAGLFYHASDEFHGFVDSAGDAVGGAVGSFIDAVTFWDN